MVPRPPFLFLIDAFVVSFCRKYCKAADSHSWGVARKMVFERLPTSVRPVNYKLQLQPDLEKLTFQGQEDIQLDVKEVTNKVILNARELKISKAVLSGYGEECSPKVEYNTEEEKALLTFGRTLQPGTYSLKLHFTGILNDELRGFYRTKYQTPCKQQQRNGAITHFEATGARRAFPCFDEPSIRATFDITLIVPKDRLALSNMPVLSEHDKEDDHHWKVVKFDRTPVMSTYLVAFVVGEFDIARCYDEDGTEIRVYTPRSKGEQGIYAAEVAMETLPFYKKYFDVPYGLPKLDLVAAPDFPIGAMENWGLVIYREGALLVDLINSSSRTKEYVALIVGHELAHNWFGNLVTMNWWTHLWLKEGFASWIEYLCVDHCFPEYDVWTQFVSMDLGRALKLDALENSHPIEIEVGNPAEVDEIFDAISYCKGASIIRMLHNYLGDEDFRKGMTIYLKRHQYSSACTEDLWKALEEASSKPVGAVMSTWTSQKGFPVLTVTEKQTGCQRVLEIKQQKFSASLNQSSGGSGLWITPVTFTTQSSPTTPLVTVLMEEPTLTIALDVLKEEWVKLNSGSTGVYRVQYSPEMLKKFIPSIKDKVLPPTDRLGIISDLFALCQVGLVSSTELLDVVRAFTMETNFTVWNDLLANLSEMGRLLQYTNATDDFQDFICHLLGPLFADLGWENVNPDEEDHLLVMLRELVITTLGVNGEQSVIEDSHTALLEQIEERRPIPSDLRKPVYKTVMCHGTLQDYNRLKEMYTQTDAPEEKTVIGCSFGSSQDPNILKDALQFAVSDCVRSQDSPSIIAFISAGSAQGRELAWSFFKDNYKMLYQRYSSSTLLARLVKCTVEDFASEEKAADIEEFFKAHPAPSAERTVSQSCEKIRRNAQWLQREADRITKYLKDIRPPEKQKFSKSSGDGVNRLQLEGIGRERKENKPHRVSIIETAV